MFLSESLKAQRTQKTLKVEGICQNCGIVRIAEGAEDAEGRGIFCVFCVFCVFWDSYKSVGHLSPRWACSFYALGTIHLSPAGAERHKL